MIITGLCKNETPILFLSEFHFLPQLLVKQLLSQEMNSNIYILSEIHFQPGRFLLNENCFTNHV